MFSIKIFGVKFRGGFAFLVLFILQVEKGLGKGEKRKENKEMVTFLYIIYTLLYHKRKIYNIIILIYIIIHIYTSIYNNYINQ